MENTVSLILVNASVLTMDPQNPLAQAVAIAGERIAAVGTAADMMRLHGPGTEVVDCRALPLIPGIHDAHTHVLATAASQSGLNCRPPRIDCIGKLLSAIHARALELPPGRWIRGYGLDPATLREGRYPTRQELDAVADGHPVRLEHSSGHAALLNGVGLAAAGIDASTPDPADGVIERDGNGEPTGLLLEMGGYLRERLGNTRSTEEMEADVIQLSESLLSYGVTSVQDAGPENDLARWETFRSLSDRGLFSPRVTMMAGACKLDEMACAGLAWGHSEGRVRLGHAKIILTCTTGQLQPAPEDLADMVFRAHQLGFPVAIHAIEQQAVEAALRAIGPVQASNGKTETIGASQPPRSLWRDRLEHCSECPPPLMEEVAKSGAMVVTQPGFIYWRGDGYLERVEPALLPHLYAIRRMADHGIPLAFGSDSPVVDPSPWPGIFSAVTVLTKDGCEFPLPGGVGGDEPGMTLGQALYAHTAAGAFSEGTETHKGMIRPGMIADLALLDRNLDETPHADILRAKSLLTLIGGQVAWRDGGVPGS